MSKKMLDGVWIVECDWKGCDLGFEGGPAQFVDPDGGRDPNKHFQCGRHHGVIPQAEKPEFQLPEDHKLNIEEIKQGADKVTIEEIKDDE